MAHRLALGGGEARDVGDDRLRHVLLDPRGRALLGVAADLADHDDEVRVGIRLESRQRVNVGGAHDRVAADPQARRETEVAQLVHELVGQRARLRDEAEAARARNVRRGDAQVRLPGRDDAGAVRAYQANASLERALDDDGRVLDGDALGDEDNRLDARLDGLQGGALRESRGYEDNGGVRAGGLAGLGDRPEDGDLDLAVRDPVGARAVALHVESDGRARLAGVRAAHDGRAGAQHALGVLAALSAGHALDDDPGIRVDEDSHGCSPAVLGSLLRRRLGCELGCAPGRPVHRFFHVDERVRGLLEDRAALLDLIAVQAHNQRLGGRVAQRLERADNTAGDLVAGGNAAEDVDEHGANLLVTEDDVQALRHDLGRGAAADVQEVRGLHAAELLAGHRDHVEGRHDQARSVADDADLALQTHVVEPGLLRGGLARILRRHVHELGVAGVTEARVVVEGHLTVDRPHGTIRAGDQRVDLDQRRILVAIDGPQGLEDGGDRLRGFLIEARLLGDAVGDLGVDADDRVQGDAGQGLGALLREGLDVHAALARAHRQVAAVRAVQQDREVVFGGDVRADSDHDLLDDVALDVKAEDRLGLLVGLVGGVGELDAAGLTAAARLHLSLDDQQRGPLSQEFTRALARLVGG